MSKNHYTPEQQIIAFWKKVNKNGSIPAHCPELGQCWEWVASLNKWGYGTKVWNEKQEKAHRVSWVIAYGKIPDGLWVLHKCDNRKCVNPQHLFLGTRYDNVEDMKKKGRSNSHKRYDGMQNLSRKQVIEIRERYSSGNISQVKLADEYKIQMWAIWFIINFNDW